MRKLLFRSRSGEGYPMVIAVTLCLLMLFMVIAEYFRVNIIVQGVRDAVQQAVIATVNENYDDVYHSVREGYAAGWFPEGDGEWFESIDAGDIYGNLSYILGLTATKNGRRCPLRRRGAAAPGQRLCRAACRGAEAAGAAGDLF